jgi:hypothetical protein
MPIYPHVPSPPINSPKLRHPHLLTPAEPNTTDHDHENPDNQQRHRDDLLAKQKRGQGHWKPELASNSEEAIKADRAEAEDIRTLQNRTKATAEETSRNRTSMRDGL